MKISNTECPHCGARADYTPSAKPVLDPENGRDLVVPLVCTVCTRGFFFSLNSRHAPAARSTEAQRAGPIQVSKPGRAAPSRPAEPPAPVGPGKAAARTAPVFEPAAEPALGRPVHHAPRRLPESAPPPPEPRPLPPPPAVRERPAAPVPAPGPSRSPDGAKKKEIPSWALVPILVIVAALVLVLVPSNSTVGDPKTEAPQQKAPEPPQPPPPAAPQPVPPVPQPAPAPPPGPGDTGPDLDTNVDPKLP